MGFIAPRRLGLGNTIYLNPKYWATFPAWVTDYLQEIFQFGAGRDSTSPKVMTLTPTLQKSRMPQIQGGKIKPLTLSNTVDGVSLAFLIHAVIDDIKNGLSINTKYQDILQYGMINTGEQICNTI